MHKLIGQIGVSGLLKAGVSEVYRKVWRECVRNSFSQNWEDVLIDKLLNHPKKGFYVEIGAYRPKRLSNTWRYYKRDWQGVVVEPNPKVVKDFKRVRARDRFVSAGIGVKDGMMKYFKFDISALNTFSEKESKASVQKGFRQSEVMDIRVIGTKSFLKKFVGNRKIDILSIDTEGWDKKILKSWDWKYKPKVICVETDKKNSIEALLIGQNYTLVAKTKHNSIFLKN